MYLAPLNYDRFFKKVFSDLEISQAFLEDVLDATIESLEMLPAKHKMTDSAIPVEFDFRCRMDGKPVIIDMQQWFKMDVVRRFYMYHAVSTALQLESLPEKIVDAGTGRVKKTRDYSGVEPVITLVWMVEETLGVKDDFLSCALFPEDTAALVRNEALWQKSASGELAAERQKVLTLLENKVKSLDFLSKNRLIYAFQANIVRNKKHLRYFRWFDFAEKSRNKDNSKADFQEYENDRIMGRIMERTSTETLEEDDIIYLTEEEYSEWQKKNLAEAVEEGKKMGVEEGKKMGVEEERLKTRQKNLEAARVLKQNGVPLDLIAKVSELPIETIEKL